ELPLERPVRVACPSCGFQMVLRPQSAVQFAAALLCWCIVVIVDEPWSFCFFLAEHLCRFGFDVLFFEIGEPMFDYVCWMRVDLAIVNVYLKGKLGVEVTEDIKNDPALSHTRII